VSIPASKEELGSALDSVAAAALDATEASTWLPESVLGEQPNRSSPTQLIVADHREAEVVESSAIRTISITLLNTDARRVEPP
jgi:hypothetical protein